MNKQRTSAALALCLALGCGDDDSSASSETDTSSSSASSTGDDAASSTGDGADETGSGGQASGTSQGGTSEGSSGETGDSAGESGDDDGGLPIDCDGATDNRSLVVCAAEAFLDTLDEVQRATVLYDWTDNEAKTAWSNLPGVTRSGITYGELGEESRAAAMVVAQAALSAQGYEDFIGLLAADDYLGEQGGGGGPGGGGGLAYSSDNYIIAFIGTPSTSSDWMLQLGGHHMAYNITYTDAETAASPNHLGAEPKGEFSVGGESYAPLTDDGEVFFALFDAMDASTLSSAQISGSYSDVLLGPDEYGTGSYDAVEFPTGSQREGILASSLSAAEQALVVEAIRAWAGDYADEVAEPLMDSYTSDEAFADTYVGWAGSSAPDPDVNGTYLRIDGPEVWIELVCQNGVVIQGQTHYHTIYRDKARDYGGSL